MTKVAIVTGGGRGIGRAIVDRLHGDGFKVVTCGRGSAPDDLPDGVYWQKTNVAIVKDCQNLLRFCIDTLGVPTVLVNNAGVQVEKTLADSSDADWDNVVGTNCRGVFNMCRAVLPAMSSHGGVIINIGSISGTVADPSMALYNASKAFVHGLTRSIAIDHGSKVRCNAILPGWIMTALADDAFALANDPAKAKADALARHPVGRFGTAQDIANMASWLASDQAGYANGQCFTIDGGMTAASPLQPGLF